MNKEELTNETFSYLEESYYNYRNAKENYTCDSILSEMRIYVATLINKLMKEENKSEDKVNHPKHYTNHPSGIECIQVIEHMNFNLGNVIKYVWRCENKNGLEDLKKAQWYLNREIERLGKDVSTDNQ
jgi:hypothetical protein